MKLLLAILAVTVGLSGCASKWGHEGTIEHDHYGADSWDFRQDQLAEYKRVWQPQQRRNLLHRCVEDATQGVRKDKTTDIQNWQAAVSGSCDRESEDVWVALAVNSESIEYKDDETFSYPRPPEGWVVENVHEVIASQYRAWLVN
jgi:hypothetical protein